MSHETSNDNATKIKAGPRAIALVGPHGGGKTSLLESIAILTGAAMRKGTVEDGSSIGDFTPEARARQMSVETNVLTVDYLGEEFTFLDCPGSVEFANAPDANSQPFSAASQSSTGIRRNSQTSSPTGSFG